MQAVVIVDYQQSFTNCIRYKIRLLNQITIYGYRYYNCEQRDNYQAKPNG